MKGIIFVLFCFSSLKHTVPDDVLAIDEKTFYVTNIYHYRKDQSVFMHNIEVFTNRPWTNLLLCSKTNEWQCSIVNIDNQFIFFFFLKN